MPEGPRESQHVRRMRGRGFPVVPLDEAAEIVREVGKHGHSHSEHAVATYMGHRTTNSGAFKQRFAAMRSWGLITVEHGQVSLTELGRRIAHPLGEDAGLALREAFMHAEVFADLYADSAKGQGLGTETLGNRAVQHLGVSPKSAGKFAQCFARSALAAGLASQPAPGRLELLSEKEVPESPSPSQLPEPGEGEGEALPSVMPAAGSAERVVHQVWPARGGSIAFEVRLDRPLSAHAFAELAEIFRAVERLVGELGDGSAQTDAREP